MLLYVTNNVYKEYLQILKYAQPTTTVTSHNGQTHTLVRDEARRLNDIRI
jgi:hypothetical protein